MERRITISFGDAYTLFPKRFPGGLWWLWFKVKYCKLVTTEIQVKGTSLGAVQFCMEHNRIEN